MKLQTAILWSLVLVQFGAIAGLALILAVFGLGPYRFKDCWSDHGGMTAMKKLELCLSEPGVMPKTSAR